MRQILEDAALKYVQEAPNLLIIIAPAAISGPIFVLAAGAGVVPGLVMLPLFLACYLASYAASVRAAAFMTGNLSPDPAEAYRDVFDTSSHVVRAAIPGVLLSGAVAVLALFFAHQGPTWLAGALVPLGAVAVFYWAGRHAYDQPLILAHSLPATEALRGGEQLAGTSLSWTLVLLGALVAPLAVVTLLCLGFSAVLTPTFGGVVFILALAFWLPLPAFALTTACGWLIGASAPAPEPEPAPGYRPWN